MATRMAVVGLFFARQASHLDLLTTSNEVVLLGIATKIGVIVVLIHHLTSGSDESNP